MHNIPQSVKTYHVLRAIPNKVPLYHLPSGSCFRAAKRLQILPLPAKVGPISKTRLCPFILAGYPLMGKSSVCVCDVFEI